MQLDGQRNDHLPQPGHTSGQGGHPVGTRRRGEVLEDAILNAAWDELNGVGYTHLTMEAVARRAKTNKAAIYRRWPSKAKLVAAAWRRHMPAVTKEVPDTGDLRNDVMLFLDTIVQPLQMIGAETLHGLMVDLGGLLSSLPQMDHQGVAERWNASMMTILRHAEQRGEVDSAKGTPRILSLPADLLRYELLITHEPVTDETVAEIVDDIFLPLVRT